MPDGIDTVQEDYFNERYSQSIDPWDYEHSPYEDEKYKTTVAALNRDSYKSIFEIACSIGVLSEMLVEKSLRLLCVDMADAALEVAKKRLAPYAQVQVKKMMVPYDFPTENFEAIIVSEMAYYLNMKDLQKLGERIVEHLEDKGQLVLVHWLPFVEEHPLTGDEVHDYFMTLANADGPFQHVHHDKREKYRLDVFEKR